MESAHHSSSRPDCNNTAEVPSFTLRTALSALPFVSDLCGVDVPMIPGKIFTGFAKIHRIASVNDFWFPRRLQELHEVLLFLLGSFCFARVRLYPPCCQVLYHKGISMIVSRFTFFTENFVIRCDQVTKMFRSGHDCTSTSSAKTLVIFDLKQMSQFRSFGK